MYLDPVSDKQGLGLEAQSIALPRLTQGLLFTPQGH